jgi:hypothetical protein
VARRTNVKVKVTARPRHSALWLTVVLRWMLRCLGVRLHPDGAGSVVVARWMLRCLGVRLHPDGAGSVVVAGRILRCLLVPLHPDGAGSVATTKQSLHFCCVLLRKAAAYDAPAVTPVVRLLVSR